MHDNKGLIKFQGLRGIIAKKMTHNLQNTAQLSFLTDIDASAIIEARQAFKLGSLNVGYEDIFIHALVKTLRGFPQFNAIETEKGIQPQSEINVSCAIGVDDGLIAPAIFNCDGLSIIEIAEKRRDLILRAQSNSITIEEHTSGTITISNLGLTCVRHFTPILSHPQQAIIGLGQIVKRPWVESDGETIVVKPIMGLSLTVDHRAIDGTPAGEFLTSLASSLETYQRDS